jgi:hypothetical protein
MRRALANGLRLAFAVAAVTLAVRAFLGPLTFPIAVRSPINAEGWLAMAVALLVAMGLRPAPMEPVTPERPLPRARSRRLDLCLLLSLMVLIGAVFAGSRNDAFLADDFLLIQYARDFTFDLHRLLTTPGGDGFFRPVTHIFFGLLYRWAGFDPLRWHVAGFVLHEVNTALVFAILRRMGLARPPAWFAAALFAIHATRPEAVVWVGGRFDLLATFFVLASVALFLAFLDAGEEPHVPFPHGRRWFYWGAALVATVLGILSKESAYAGPPILAMIALTRRHDSWTRGTLKRWAVTLTPFFAVVLALFAYRWVLFGGIGGYLDSSGRPQALLLSPVNVVKALAFRIWAVLVFPLDWNATSALTPGFLVCAAMVAYLGALAWMTTARVVRRGLIAPLGFVLLASIPPLQQLLIGPDMEKARYLYLPAAGFCWLLAVVLEALGPLAARAAGAAILLFNLAAIGHNLAAWHFASRQAHSACIAAASCARDGDHRLLAIGLPRTVRGVPLFAWGFEECARMEMGPLEKGDSLTVVLRDTPASAAPTDESAGYACVLEWDPVTSELRRIR